MLLVPLVILGCDREGRRAEGSHHTLGNGMEVILVRNRATPMVSSIVCVKAGSAYEDGTNNGVSHLLEHLLFDGTGERTRIEIMEGIENRGGYLNATTRDDHTAYILLIPSEHVEFGLDVQADMLFHSIFPDSELVKERKVVIEEIHKDTDNPTYLAEKFHRSFLFQGTPFTRPVIGFRNIIASVSREEVIRYYRERYVPEKMVAIVTGNFDEEEMLATIERIFGVIPPGKNPADIRDVRLPRRPNRMYRLDSESDVSYVHVSFDAPAPDDPEFYAFDLFVRILSHHEGSPLSAALKGGSEPLTHSLATDLSPHPGFSTLTFSFTTEPGKEEEALETLIGKIEEESSREPDPAEIEGVLVDIKSNEYFLKERHHYYGLMKAPFLVSAGFEFLDSYIDRMASVTPAEILKVAENHFSHPRYVATVVGPSRERPETDETIPGEVHLGRTLLENGLRLVIKEEADSDIFAVHVLAGNRAYLEPDGKSGASDFLSRLLLRGTTTRDRATLAADLASIGANVTLVDNPYVPYDDYYTSRRYAFIRFETLGESWRDGLDILADMIRNPAFEPDERIESVRQELMSLIARRDQSTYQTARRLFYETLFAGHPFSRSILGTEAEIEEIRGVDLKWLHDVLYAPNNLVISVVSGIPTDSIRRAFVDRFADMPRVEPPFEYPTVPEQRRGLERVEERMGKEQAYITMGDLLPGIESDDVPAIQMAISILSDRLALELREKQGLAYSVGASAQFARGFGWYTISMGTEQTNYRRAVDGIRREIDRMRRERLTAEELRNAILRTHGNAQMKRLSSIGRAYFLGLNEFLLDDYRESDLGLERWKRVGIDDIQRVAREYIRADEGVLVSVR
jgi:predicted Zn-dependent peptidase